MLQLLVLAVCISGIFSFGGSMNSIKSISSSGNSVSFASNKKKSNNVRKMNSVVLSVSSKNYLSIYKKVQEIHAIDAVRCPLVRETGHGAQRLPSCCDVVATSDDIIDFEMLEESVLFRTLEPIFSSKGI